MTPAAPAVFLVLVLAATAWVYWPGLGGPFMLDDGPNIVRNPLIQIRSLELDALRGAAMSFSGTPGRPLSMLTLAVNHRYAGLDPRSYKAVNLAVHLLAGAALFAFARLLLGAWARGRGQPPGRDMDAVALLAAGVWLLHPLNVSAVLYVIQRMTGLAALFVALGLWAYLAGRMRMLDGRRGGVVLALCGPLAGGGLAVLCKENGVLMVAYMAVIELCVLGFRGRTPAQGRRLRRVYLGAGLLAGLGALLWLAASAERLAAGYQIRDFSLGERLLTQPRVLLFYLRLILWPDPAAMGLFHDDFLVSRGLLQPPATMLAILALSASAGTALAMLRRRPLAALAVLWFLAGHALEATLLPLELVFEHRNYLPAFGILLALAAALWTGLSRCRALRIPVVMLVLSLLGMVTALRAQEWSSGARWVASELRHHPHSARAHAAAGALYARRHAHHGDAEYYRAAAEHLSRCAELSPRAPDCLVDLMMLADRAGRSPEARWRTELESRLARGAVGRAVLGPLQDWVFCLRERCTTTGPDAAAAIESLAANSDTGPAVRAFAWNLLAILSFDCGDREAAGRAVQEAVSLAPGEPLYRLGLARWLASMGRAAEALQELALAERLDRGGRFRAAITAERERLAEVDPPVSETAPGGDHPDS